jgi:L-alanine-DL-glutamate epimerase-like enolase superfamily enzyme
MKLFLEEHLLELKHTFTISRTSRDSQPSLIVKLVDGNYTGLGEATANPYYHITVKKMMDDLIHIQSIIESNSNLTPEDFWSVIYPYLKNNVFALCALDVAYNDLYAKKQHHKLYEIWNLKPKNNPLTNFTIGIDTIENMVAKMIEMPWPIYKIKLGTKNDIEIIKNLRKHTTAIFRVDANCGWTVEETLKNAIELKKLGVEFIEQPLAADNWEGHKILYNNSVLPIIADESCQIESDIEKCHHHFHGVNIKLTKCGGVTPGKRMLDKAIELGLKTMVGCMTESSVGIAAIAHLLPLLDYVDMDGALLLKNDIAEGVKIIDGKIIYSVNNGTGAKLIK